MDPQNPKRRRQARRLRERCTKFLVVAVLVAVPTAAMAADNAPTRKKSRGKQATSIYRAQSGLRDFDVRDGAGTKSRNGAQTSLKRSLGPDASVDVNPITGTPNVVEDPSGFLTRRHKGSARQLVLRYVRSHPGVFRLDANDLSGLKVSKQYTTGRGLTHIEFHEVYRGIAAFDNGLRANLKDGRLVNVTGSPAPDLSVPSAKPAISAASATERALANAGEKKSVKELSQRRGGKSATLSGGNLAGLVIFVGPGGPRLAWSVIASAGKDAVYRIVVDASSGRALKRANLVDHASLSAFPYYPGAPAGGSQVPVLVPTTGADPWLAFGFNELRGDNSWAYSDQNDDRHFKCDGTGSGPYGCTNEGDPATGNTVAPTSNDGTSGATFAYSQVVDTSTPTSNRTCPSPHGCTWNGFDISHSPFTSAEGGNWQRNREQAATQDFYFVNNFHDYTQNDGGIQFDDSSGNFEETADPGAIGGDPVHTQALDGAATGTGGDFPDADHIENANMLTLPEADSTGPVPYPFKAPQMQMYLFTANNPFGLPSNDVNGGDDAAIVYHEFTHGLSERLVDPEGTGGLETPQGGAMGEAWSDWYAMDYLNAAGLQPDSAASHDVAFGAYENLPVRSQPMDCPVFARAATPPGLDPGPSEPCQGGNADWYGGYTYGDFGAISGGGPEVHADGEIWGETLWQLRNALIAAHGTGSGLFRARAVITDAMRLSQTDPDFLSMRNSILQAARIDGFGQRDCRIAWSVFANRGMGRNASTVEGTDDSPVQDFVNPGNSLAFCPADPTTGGGGGTSGGGTSGGGTSGGGSSSNKPAKANLAGAKKSVRVSRKGNFTYSFRATPGLQGKVTFNSIKKVKITKRKRVTLAKKSFTVPTSGKVKLKIKLSKKKLRILRKNKKVKVRVTVIIKNSAGSSKATKTLTLKAPKKH